MARRACQDRVLVLEDWALAPLEPAAHADMLETADDRDGSSSRAKILTTQLPVERCHAWLSDATIADAILDRLLAREHHISLKGESLRRQRPNMPTKPEVNTTTT